VLLSRRVYRNLLGVTFDDAAEIPVSAEMEGNSMLAPETGFSELVGDEPNGTWMLICDDIVPGLSGAFTWRLEIATIDLEPVRSVSTVSSSLGWSLGANSTTATGLEVSAPGFVCDVEVEVHITHPNASDLRLILRSPDEFRTCRLLESRGSTGNFYLNAHFDDSAVDLGRWVDTTVPLGTVAPLGSLGRFTDLDAEGLWSLLIFNEGVEVGNLLGWELTLTTCAAPLPETFCTGAAPAPCPCSNNGALGNGCANAAHAGGARLTAIVPGGAAHVGDDVVLSASDLDPFQLVLFVQGTQAANGGVGQPLGDGLLCATGQIVRLATRYSGFGSVGYPGLFDLPLSRRGGIPPGGGTRVYQALFRSSVLFGPCHTGLNSTNGVRLTWVPQLP
jgi:subtilisin-like proprotein convertase family protein